jgi:hypothetical protein
MTGYETKIVFPHIPKTGGTTLLYHFRKAYGDDRVMILGPHNRVSRFFAGQPQFEELTPDEMAGFRVIMGHGVDEQTLALLDPDKVRLLVVWRHPLTLTRSRYNHRYGELKRKGVELSPRRFLKEQPNDFVSSALLEKFPGFVDPKAKRTHERVQSVLQKFDHVLTTEKMDQQARRLFESLGLPTAIERRRVAEAWQDLAANDAVILRRNQVDLRIFERCNVVLENDGTMHNAIGFDAEAKRSALVALNAGVATAEQRSERCHEVLVQALCGGLMAEAALARAAAEPATLPVSQPDLFAERLRAAWESHRTRLKPAPLQYSARNLQKWLAQSRNRRAG